MQLDREITRFAEINRMCASAGAWLVSVPGDFEVRVECVAGSEIPQRLRELGHELIEEPAGTWCPMFARRTAG